MYIGRNAKLDMSNITFLNNQAEFGAAFSYQKPQSSIYTYNDLTFIYDATSTLLATTIKSQVELNSGGLILKNIKIPRLKTPFLSLSSGAVKVEDINIQNLECQAADNSIKACLFDIDDSQILDIAHHSCPQATSPSPQPIPATPSVSALQPAPF